MNMKELYAIFSNKLVVIMRSQDEISSIEELQKLLEDNKSVFIDKDTEKTFSLLFSVVIGFMVGVIFSTLLFQSKTIVFLIAIASALVFFLFAYLLQSAFTYRINSEVIFLKKLIERGWNIDYKSPKTLWNEYASDHFFLNKGDLCDELHCAVYGKTDMLHNFIYFDYFYTIEIEEDVEKEDSDGEVYSVTEYSEESYTETCLFIEKESDLPFITVNAPLSGIRPLKFSNIQLNHQVKVFTKESQKAYTFFDPLTQIGFSTFYKYFPSATIQIDKRGIFINFCEDLTNIPHTVLFDMFLADKMDSPYLVKRVENILHSVCNELMPSFQSITIIKKKEELENA